MTNDRRQLRAALWGENKLRCPMRENLLERMADGLLDMAELAELCPSDTSSHVIALISRLSECARASK